MEIINTTCICNRCKTDIKYEGRDMQKVTGYWEDTIDQNYPNGMYGWRVASFKGFIKYIYCPFCQKKLELSRWKEGEVTKEEFEKQIIIFGNSTPDSGLVMNNGCVERTTL